jgi:hypothetical protein
MLRHYRCHWGCHWRRSQDISLVNLRIWRNGRVIVFSMKERTESYLQEWPSNDDCKQIHLICAQSRHPLFHQMECPALPKHWWILFTSNQSQSKLAGDRPFDRCHQVHVRVILLILKYWLVLTVNIRYRCGMQCCVQPQPFQHSIIRAHPYPNYPCDWPPPAQLSQCNGTLMCPSTAYQGARTHCLHPIWMWDAAWGCAHPWPWQHTVI